MKKSTSWGLRGLADVGVSLSRNAYPTLVQDWSTRMAALTGLFLWASASAFGQYCTTGVGPTDTADSNIDSVYIAGSTYNISKVPSCAATGVENYTATDSVDLNSGSNYTLQVSLGSCSGSFFSGRAQAYIDWDNDQLFETSESIGSVAYLYTDLPFTSNFAFQVPAWVPTSGLRMRIIMWEGASAFPLNPCGSFTWGTVVDFSVNVTNNLPCPAPYNVVATGISQTGANIGFTTGGSTHHDFEYGAPGFVLGTGTQVLNQTGNPYALSGLSASTSYDVYVRDNCGLNGNSAWSGPVSFTTLASCNPVTNLVGLPTGDGVILTWAETSASDTYTLEYGTLNFVQGAGTTVGSGTTEAYTITGLAAATAYDVYVRKDCGVNGTSTWVKLSFTTARPVPYSTDFATYPPAGWTERDGNIANPTVFTSTTASDWGVDGFLNVGTTGAARVNIWSTGRFEWMCSPTIYVPASTGYTVKFDIGFTDFSNSNAPEAVTATDDTVFIVVSTDGGATWLRSNVIKTYVQGSMPSHLGQTEFLDLSGFSGPIQIGFYGESTVSNWDNDLHVDNFSIISTPTCGEPTGISSSNVTYNQANIQWTANNQFGAPQDFTIEYGVTGFALGTGTQVTDAASPATLTSLASNTTYQYYVRQNCTGSNGSSAWVGPFSFTTNVLVSGVQFWNFESESTTAVVGANPAATLVNSWRLFNLQTSFRWETEDASGTDENSTSTGPTFDKTTGAVGGKYLFTEANGVLNDSTFAITPFVDITGITGPELNFWYHMYGATTGTLAVDVWNNGVWQRNRFSLSGQQQTSGAEAWRQAKVTLVGLTGAIQVRFRGVRGSSFTGDMAIDDVGITSEPCQPATNVFVDNITASSARINWTSGFGVNQYRIEYGPTGFALGTGTSVQTSGNVRNLTSLLANTEYQYYFENRCYGVDTVLSGPFTFRTLCTGPLNGTVTVDPGMPVSATNFQSFQALRDGLSICGINGPVTVNVKEGIYGRFQLDSIPGSSTINTVTIRSNPLNVGDVILQATALVAADNYLIRLFDVDHVRIQDLVFDPQGGTYGRGVVFEGGNNNIQITNNTFNGEGLAASTNNASIFDNSGLANRSTDVLIDGNTIDDASYGIYSIGVGSTDFQRNWTITNNTIGAANYGVYLQYMDSVVVEDNTIRPATVLASNSTSYGVYALTENGMIDVIGNDIVRNGSSTNYGVYLINADGFSLNYMQIANNSIALTGGTASSTQYGIWVSNCSFTEVLFNSVNVTIGSATTSRPLYVTRSTVAPIATDLRILNNAFVNNTGYAAELAPATYTAYITAMNHNAYFTNGVNKIRANAINYTDVESFFVFSSFDANSLLGNPGFTGPSNLLPTNGFLNEGGTPFGDITDDIEGNLRSLTVPDIGCYEYAPPACPVAISVGTYALDDSLYTLYNHLGIRWKNGGGTTRSLRWGPAGTDPDSMTNIVTGITDSFYVVSGLTSGVSYSFYVREFCSAFDSSDYSSVFSASTVCPVATALSVVSGSTTSSSVQLRWRAGNYGSGFTVVYGPANFNPVGGGILIENVLDTFVTVSGLMANTNYDFYVRSFCSANDSSNLTTKVTQRTACGIFSAPVSANFTDVAGNLIGTQPNLLQLANCFFIGAGTSSASFRWETEASTGTDNNSTATGPAFDNTTPTTVGGIYIFLETSSGTTGDRAFVVSPEVDLTGVSTPMVQFAYHLYGATMDTLRLDVKGSDGVWDNNVWSVFGQQQTSAAAPYTTVQVPIWGFAGDTIQIRFMGRKGSSFTGDMALDDIFIGAGPSCLNPIAISAVATSTSSASVSVTPSSSVIGYEVTYGPTGFNPALTGTTVSSASSPIALTGLTGGDGWDYYVRQICGAGDTSVFPGVKGSVNTACAVPTALVANPVGVTTATLGWSTSLSGTGFEVEYGTTGFALGSGTRVFTAVNSLSLAGLVTNTNYQWYVRAACDTAANDYSAWSAVQSFSTQCLTPAPATVNFTGIAGNQFPSVAQGSVKLTNCWTLFAGNTSGFRWETEASTGTDNNSTATGPAFDATTPAVAGGIYLFLETSSSVVGDSAEVFSPLFDVSSLTNVEIDFAYHMYGATMGTLALDVWSQGTGWVRNVASFTGQQQTGFGEAWRVSKSFLSNQFTDEIQLRFRGIRGTDFTGDMALDDIKVFEAPSCPFTGSTAVASITATTAQVNYTPGLRGTTMLLEYGPDGFTPGTGTFVSTAGNSFNLTGLTANVLYDYVLRTICGASDTSVDALLGSFRTLTIPATVPFVNDINSGVGVNLGLSNNANATLTEGVACSSNGLVFGSSSGTTGWTGTSTGTTATNAWTNNTTYHSSASVIVDATGVPSIDSLGLNFDLRQTFSFGNKFAWFRVLVNGTQISPDYNPTTQAADLCVTRGLDLTPYVGTSFTLTFQAANKNLSGNNGTDKAFLDNISITSFACDEFDPSVNIGSRYLATFGWDAIPGATNYQLQYRQVGDTIWTQPTTTSLGINRTLLGPGLYEYRVGAFVNAAWTYGCTREFTVTCFPLTAAAIVSEAPFCVNDPATIKVNYSGGVGAKTFLWSTGETTRNIVVQPDSTYYVTVTDVYGCSASDTIYVPQPAGSEYGTSLISVGKSGANFTVNWNAASLPGGVSNLGYRVGRRRVGSGAAFVTSPLLSAATTSYVVNLSTYCYANYEFVVYVRYKDGALPAATSAPSCPIARGHNTGGTGTCPPLKDGEGAIAGSDEVNGLSISSYPNPTNDELFVVVQGVEAQIELLDLSGKRVMSSKHVGENEVKLSLGHLSKGVYTLRVSTAQGVVSQKVILE